VSTDNRKGGVVAAKRMGEKLGGKGKVAILGVKKGSVSTDEREEGFRDTIQKDFPGITLVPIIFYGEANAAKSLDVAENVLTSHSFSPAFCASNKRPSAAAVPPIPQPTLVGKDTLFGFDAPADLVQNVREGAIDSLVLQNPFKMGYEGVKTIVDKLGGKQP